MGGDFNCILNPLIDRLPPKAMPLSPQDKALSNICEELGLAHVWRTIHTADKAYAFFLAPHGCHSRIDYFFLSGLSLHRVLTCSIGSILISDHANVILDLTLKGINSGVKYWRLNTSILKDNTFSTYCTTEFRDFISTNTQITLLWETAKAYARGLIISFSASKKRQKREKKKLLMDELKAKKKSAYVRSPSSAILKEISAV